MFHFRCPRCDARRFANLERLRMSPIVRCAACKFEWEFDVAVVEAGHAYASHAIDEMRSTLDEELFRRLMTPRENGVWAQDVGDLDIEADVEIEAEAEHEGGSLEALPAPADAAGPRRSVRH
ncbi:MAG: hypothetical protein QM766_17380 [Burkholderiaceae bacterium]